MTYGIYRQVELILSASGGGGEDLIPVMRVMMEYLVVVHRIF